MVNILLIVSLGYLWDSMAFAIRTEIIPPLTLLLALRNMLSYERANGLNIFVKTHWRWEIYPRNMSANLKTVCIALKITLGRANAAFYVTLLRSCMSVVLRNKICAWATQSAKSENENGFKEQKVWQEIIF